MFNLKVCCSIWDQDIALQIVRWVKHLQQMLDCLRSVELECKVTISNSVNETIPESSLLAGCIFLPKETTTIREYHSMKRNTWCATKLSCRTNYDTLCIWPFSIITSINVFSGYNSLSVGSDQAFTAHMYQWVLVAYGHVSGSPVFLPLTNFNRYWQITPYKNCPLQLLVIFGKFTHIFTHFT